MTLMVNGMSILGVDPFVQQVVTGAIVIGAVAVTMDRSRLFVTK
jgi:ABC-type xylose transport system permease subunit